MRAWAGESSSLPLAFADFPASGAFACVRARTRPARRSCPDLAESGKPSDQRPLAAFVRPSHAQAPALLDDSRALAQRDGRARPALDRSPIGRECDLIILNAGDAVAAGKWWMEWAQSISQSMGVLRFGPPDGAMTLPSGPITGSRSGRETLVSAAVVPGTGSSPLLRPHPATLSAATSAPIAAIRAGRSSD